MSELFSLYISKLRFRKVGGYMKSFTHIDAKGNAVMVDVSEKDITARTAVAAGVMKKGDVLGTAQIAGIMGAKRTSDLIPLCHILNLTKCGVEYSMHDESCEIEARCTVKCSGRTGVEMEALTGVTVTLLTIYDMCKAVDKHMVIRDIHLLEKQGGKSGYFVYDLQGGRL